MDDEVLDPDVTDDEITSDADEPTYQDWTELQAPVACSWCWALVPRDRVEEHTTMHLDIAATLRSLRNAVILLQSAQSTA